MYDLFCVIYHTYNKVYTYTYSPLSFSSWVVFSAHQMMRKALYLYRFSLGCLLNCNLASCVCSVHSCNENSLSLSLVKIPTPSWTYWPGPWCHWLQFPATCWWALTKNDDFLTLDCHLDTGRLYLYLLTFKRERERQGAKEILIT